MLEKAHIKRVEDQLKKLGTMHSQSMTYASLTANGTPDRYYDGEFRDLWVEFKRLTSMPRGKIAIGDLSELQIRWLTRRWRAGKNAVVAVGLPNNTIILQRMPEEWRVGASITSAMPHKDLARIIWNHCNGSTHICESK